MTGDGSSNAQRRAQSGAGATDQERQVKKLKLEDKDGKAIPTYPGSWTRDAVWQVLKEKGWLTENPAQVIPVFKVYLELFRVRGYATGRIHRVSFPPGKPCKLLRIPAESVASKRWVYFVWARKSPKGPFSIFLTVPSTTSLDLRETPMLFSLFKDNMQGILENSVVKIPGKELKVKGDPQTDFSKLSIAISDTDGTFVIYDLYEGLVHLK
eukprot:Clim_evm3s136 gene=Clim_evmTU3s136